MDEVLDPDDYRNGNGHQYDIDETIEKSATRYVPFRACCLTSDTNN